jgi:hypothetical protein
MERKWWTCSPSRWRRSGAVLALWLVREREIERRPEPEPEPAVQPEMAAA